MIKGTGIDIVEIDRFNDAVAKWGDSFLGKIFTKEEIRYSSKRRFSGQHFAARFAAKEAIMKAFGDDLGQIKKWTDIEIKNVANGKPVVELYKSAKKLKTVKHISDIMISMSHSHKYAIAHAVLISE